MYFFSEDSSKIGFSQPKKKNQGNENQGKAVWDTEKEKGKLPVA